MFLSLRPFCPRVCNPFGKARPLDTHHNARRAVWQAIPLTCDAPTRYHGLHSPDIGFFGAGKNVH
jgi:hypothetical protein